MQRTSDPPPGDAGIVRTVLAALPSPVVLSRLEDGLVRYANEPAARAFGIPLEELVGAKTPNLYADPKDREAIVAILKRDGRLVDHEVLLRSADGSDLWVLANSEPVDFEGERVLCTTFLDIGDRRRAEQAMRGAREFAESVLATVRQPLVVLGHELRVVSANRAFCRTFGARPDEVAGKQLGELCGGAWRRAGLERIFAEILERGSVETDIEVTASFPGLGERTMLLDARKVYRPGNHTDTVLLSIEDVTERRRQHDELVTVASSARVDAAMRGEQLAETERRLATVLRNMRGIGYRCRNDEQWTMELVSEGCRELTGYAPEELMGNRTLSYADLIVEEDQGRVWDEVQAALAAKQPFELEYRIWTREGETRWVWERGVGIYRDGPEGIEVAALEGIIHDVTERRLAEQQRQEMEAQMRAAQRMEAIGRLAAGVAHDFNNLLTVIHSYAGFIEDGLGEGDPAREDVRTILEASDRAAALTSQLLAFGRRQVQQLAVVALDGVVADVDRMLRRLIGEDIELVTRLDAAAGTVRVDVTQIEQVLMNLAVNARDAMPDGGRLVIETRDVELDYPRVGSTGATIPTGRYVTLAVSDDGTGMTPEVQARIFEPFFSTKEQGRGTGLGLSTVYGIVKQSGGYIAVRSEEGRGTTFEILLPQVEGEPRSPAPRRPAATDPQGDETILLVEDEETVRRATARILKSHGYRVLEADHGGEALMVCERHEGPIHLMLTDIVMPHLSGRELADRIAARKPELRVIFMSGYAEDAVGRHGVLDEGVVFLHKPFGAEELVSKVRETLDAR